MNEGNEYRPSEDEIKNQEDFFNMDEEGKEKAKMSAESAATRDYMDRKIKQQYEEDIKSADTKNVRELAFEDLKKGDVLYFEEMQWIDFHKIRPFLDRLDERAEKLPDGDPKKDRIIQTTQAARTILEDAYSRKVGEHHRNLLFKKVEKVLYQDPSLFPEEGVSSVCRMEILGERTMKSKDGKENYVIARVDKEHDSTSHRDLTVRIKKGDIIDNIDEKLGEFKGGIRTETGHYRSIYNVIRIGNIYLKPKAD